MVRPVPGDASKRVLDPACGSGIFLVSVIKHICRRVAAGQIDSREALDLILHNRRGDFGSASITPGGVRIARIAVPSDLRESIVETS